MDLTRIANVVSGTSTSIDLGELSQCESLDDMIEFCVRADLKNVGDGSARVVFELDPKRVIKIARAKKGVGQNETEYETYRMGDEKVRRVITEVDTKNHDKIFRWIICEKVTPYDFGASEWADRQYDIASIFLRIDPENMDEIGEEVKEELLSITNPEEIKFRDGIIELLSQGHDKDELISEMQMGLRENDDLVFLDFGLNG